MTTDAARTSARAALASAIGGSGRLVLITGEPGMGKTTMARDIASDARDANAIVRWAACWPGGGTVAHAPWLTLLAGLGPAGETALGALLGSEVDDPAAAASARAAAYAHVAAAIEAASSERPALLVLDDLHWADEGTVQLLTAVAGHLPATRVLVVGTYRDADVMPGAPLTRLGASPDRVHLAGLDADGVATLLGEVVGQPVSAAVGEQVRVRTGGNPFLVVQLGRLLAADPDALRGEAVLPAGARDLLGERLAALPEDDRRVLVGAAVLGSPFTAVDVAALVEQDSATVVAALDRCATARVIVRATDRSTGLGSWSFVHDLFRQAALDGVEALEVARLHRAAAAVLVDADAEPAMIARHLLAAADGHDLEAARWSVRAGERAAAAMAWEEAVAHHERALSTAPPDDGATEVRAAALLGLGSARLLAGDDVGAGRAFAEAAALGRRTGSVELVARAALGFSRDLSGFEVRLFDQRQIDLLEEAASALADAELGLRATVLARLSVALSLTASGQRRLELAEEAVALARDAGDPIVLARALAAHCDAIASPDFVEPRIAESTEIVTIGVREGDGPLELLGRRLRFVALLEAGDFAGADAEADAFVRRADTIGNPLYSWYGVLWYGQQCLASGDLDGCRAAIAEVRQLADASSSDNAAMLAVVLELSMLWVAGEYGSALDRIESIFEATPEMKRHLSATGEWARAYYLAGRTADARALLDRSYAVGLQDYEYDAEWLAAIASLLDAAVLLAHPWLPDLIDAASPHADRVAFEGIGAGLYGALACFIASGCSALGRHDEAIAFAHKGLEINRRSGRVLIADAERVLASCLGAAGRTDEADAHHRTADELYAAAGLTHRVRNAVAAPQGAAPAPEPEAVANELRRDGDVWRITYDGTSTIIKHSKGVADLAALIAAGGREVHVSELEGVPRAVVGGDGGDAVDRRAISAYKERLTELAEEIDDADAAHDLVRAEKARVEYDALIEHLSGSLGIGGRSRAAGAEPVERLRKAVAARIRDAIKRIDAVHPVLARHLTNSVRTGTFCSYQPEHPVAWRS